MNGCLLGEAIHRRPILPSLASPGHPVVRCSAPTRPEYIRVWDSTSTLVSNQERRALVFPRINRGSTVDKLRVNRSLCFSIGLHRNSFVRASRDSL